MPTRSPASAGETRAREDYLEIILELIREKGYARVADIAARLEIAPASVTGMIQRLDANGLLRYEKYRGMTLTPRGEEIASNIARRHAILTEFFALFRMSGGPTEADVEGIEHHMNEQTLALFTALTEELRVQPGISRKITNRMRALAKAPGR